jgi:hypothetical protein
MDEKAHDRHRIQAGFEEVVCAFEIWFELENVGGKNAEEAGLFFSDGVWCFSHGRRV